MTGIEWEWKRRVGTSRLYILGMLNSRLLETVKGDNFTAVLGSKNDEWSTSFLKSIFSA
jgi:hypothetical protein